MMHRLVPISAANSPTGNTHSPARRNGKAQQQRLPATPDAGTVNGEESVSVSVPSASHLNDKSDTECTGDDTCLPVLMMHGIMMSSEVFVCNAHLSLPVFLFKLGYDVWLANNRGNKYSWMHRTLRRHDPKYWDFSIDELAAYDVPAFVNRVLYLCNTRRLLYIGFSNGTAQMFAALAQDPVLNDKIALFIAMAPACKLQSLNPQRDKELTLLYPLISSNATLFYLLFGRKSMLSTADTWKRILPSDLWLKLIEWCIHILFSWKISHSSVDDKRRLCAHMYSTTSVKVIHHWFQMLRSLRFEFYNDAAGLSTNGDVVVPQYNLRQIQCKVILLHGGHDTLCNIGYLRMKLRNASYVVVPHYTHLDFLVAKDVESEVYPVVCRAIEDVCPWMLR
eukprot:Lankesteria_metandrocarpae@DN4941_c0_g1_i3.p1